LGFILKNKVLEMTTGRLENLKTIVNHIEYNTNISIICATNIV